MRVIWNGKAVVGMLRDFGLSQYEARMYFALLTTGEAKVTALSKRAYLPQSKAYGVLDSLTEKGFAELSSSERPKMYRAKALDVVMQNTIRREERFVKRLYGNCASLQSILRAIGPLYERYGAFGLFSQNYERVCKTWTKVSL